MNFTTTIMNIISWFDIIRFIKFKYNLWYISSLLLYVVCKYLEVFLAESSLFKSINYITHLISEAVQVINIIFKLESWCPACLLSTITWSLDVSIVLHVLVFFQKIVRVVFSSHFSLLEVLMNSWSLTVWQQVHGNVIVIVSNLLLVVIGDILDTHCFWVFSRIFLRLLRITLVLFNLEHSTNSIWRCIFLCKQRLWSGPHNCCLRLGGYWLILRGWLHCSS